MKQQSGQLIEVCAELADVYPDYDLAFLGFQHWHPETAEPPYTEHLSARLRRVEWADYLGGCYAYIVSAQGARRLVALVERDGIQNGVDWFIMNKSSELNVLTSFPHIITSPLAIPGSSTDSDIQYDQNPLAPATAAGARDAV